MGCPKVTGSDWKRGSRHAWRDVLAPVDGVYEQKYGGKEVGVWVPRDFLGWQEPGFDSFATGLFSGTASR